MCISCEYLVNNNSFVHKLSSYKNELKIRKVHKSFLSICYTFLNHSFYTSLNLRFIQVLRQNITLSTLSTNTITITTKKNI